MDEATVEFRLLESLQDRLSVFPVYHQLNPRLEEATFAERMKKMEGEHNYRLLAMYYENKLIGISGYWISHKLYCGKYLEPDNVVVDRNYRSQGFGEVLQKKLEGIALENGCEVMMLDAYMDNHNGHRFYERHGYDRKGFHFVKKL